MNREQAVVVIGALLDVKSLNLTDKATTQITEAIETLIALARDSKNGFWIYKEVTEQLAGGGSLLLRGYECSICKGFTRKKTGVKDFCSLCGSKNVIKILEEVKN